jgi:hypothetical protein
VAAEFFHAGGQPGRDRRTDMANLIATFRNFANAPKKEIKKERKEKKGRKFRK